MHSTPDRSWSSCPTIVYGRVTKRQRETIIKLERFSYLCSNSYYVEGGGIRATLNSAHITSNTNKLDHLSIDGLEDIVIPLHNIINCALDTNSFPANWKKAQVVPILENKTQGLSADQLIISSQQITGAGYYIRN